MKNRISDDVVKKRTGKNWKDWFSILNKAGAKKMEHKAIAQLLNTKYGLSDWWSQMVTVQYEQDIKGRKKHETVLGFQISRSITLEFPITKIFHSINSPIKRVIWLKDPGIIITKSNKDKSIRAKWVDGKTNIEVQLYPKENFKIQVVVQHNKLGSAKEAANMKLYWGKQLRNLKLYLEKH
jgi:hypothetical protein